MKILVSNDDGYLAKGINVLAESLAEVADVTVVAPDRNYSGASNSLTLHSPLRIRRVRDGCYCVNGTPSDSVHLALSGYLDFEPDLVVSGINHGANLGDDVIYSGTVAAAMEGRFLGLPAMAVSLVLDGGEHYESAARVVLALLEGLPPAKIPPATILNVNVPDRPYEQIRGVRATRLGHRHKAEPVVRARDPRGHPIYWVGPPGSEQDAGPGTDLHAVREGYASVTPIAVDLTRHDALPVTEAWVAQVRL